MVYETTMAGLDRAGVSVGSIYAHFDSLAVLMQSLWKVPVATLFEQPDR